MRRVLISIVAFGAAFAADALAQGSSICLTGTIQPAGPRLPPNGDNFVNVEGSNNGVNASYGVVRWDISALKAALNATYGPGNWAIDRVEIKLTQSNAGFSRPGNVNAYFTTDDTTDIKTTAGGLTYPFQNTPGTPDLAVDLANPLGVISYNVNANGFVDVFNAYNVGDGAQRLALRNDILNDATNMVTVVLEDAQVDVAATWRGQVDDPAGNPPTHPPELFLTVHAIVGNTPPVANAGPDQSMTDSDRNFQETFTLDGTGSSDVDGTIVSYVWSEGATQLGTGATLVHAFPTGQHTVTLTVTDNGNPPGVDVRTDTDDVIITVVSGAVPPVANAGPNQTITDTNNDCVEPFTLDGSASVDPDGAITIYEWTEGGTVLGSGPNPTLNVNLAVGTHTIRLKVTDNDVELPRQTDIDWITVDVRPANIVGGDDFEGGLPYVTRDIVPVYTYGTPAPPNWSPADGFQIYSRASSASIPFALLDDTTTFPTDNLGMVNSKRIDNWFGVNDLTNPSNTAGTGTVTWTFDIAGDNNLRLNVDMAAMGDFENSTTTGDHFIWSYSIDGGAAVDVMTSSVDEAASQTYEMETGVTFTLDDPLSMNGVTLNNRFRTITAALAGTGNTLTVQFRAVQDSDEPYAFDNVFITSGTCTQQCACVGNINTNGTSATVIDINDLTALLAAFGGPVPNACYDLNTTGSSAGVVDINDLTVLLSRFGASCN